MQRLFSNFANGWPGAGLLLQRVLIALLLVRFGITDPTNPSASLPVILQVIDGCAASLILVGLWTPIVGALIAILGLWIAASHIAGTWISIVVATLGGTGAMIGPGAWSIDARLFGRKQIES